MTRHLVRREAITVVLALAALVAAWAAGRDTVTNGLDLLAAALLSAMVATYLTGGRS